jgi:hypothetical protein
MNIDRLTVLSDYYLVICCSLNFNGYWFAPKGMLGQYPSIKPNLTQVQKILPLALAIYSSRQTEVTRVASTLASAHGEVFLRRANDKLVPGS